MKLREFIALLKEYYESIGMKIVKYMNKDNYRINLDEEISTDPDDENCIDLDFEEDINNMFILNLTESKYRYIKTKFISAYKSHGWISNFIIKTKTQTIYFIHQCRPSCPSESESLLFLLENNFTKLFVDHIIRIGFRKFECEVFNDTVFDCKFYHKPKALYNLLNSDHIGHFEDKEEYRAMYFMYNRLDDENFRYYDDAISDLRYYINLEFIDAIYIDKFLNYLRERRCDPIVINEFTVILLNYKNKHIGYDDVELAL